MHTHVRQQMPKNCYVWNTKCSPLIWAERRYIFFATDYYIDRLLRRSAPPWMLKRPKSAGSNRVDLGRAELHNFCDRLLRGTQIWAEIHIFRPRGNGCPLMERTGCQGPLKFHSFIRDTILRSCFSNFASIVWGGDDMVVNKHEGRKKTNTQWRLSSRLLFWSPVVLFNTSIRFMCRVRAFCYSPIALYGTKWPFVVTNLLCVDTSSSSTSRASQLYSRPGFVNHK